MPQRFVIYYSCSLCGAEFDHADKVQPYELAGGGEILKLDVCDGCRTGHEGFAAILAAGLPERGGKKKASAAPAAQLAMPSPSDDSVLCEYCDEYFSPAGLPHHLARIHNVKSKTASKKEAHGRGPHVCPECGFGARAPQGLAVHRFHNHGVRGASAKTQQRSKS